MKVAIKTREIIAALDEVGSKTPIDEWGDVWVLEGEPFNPDPSEKRIGDAVNHPSHYSSGKIEVIEAIEDWKLGFNLGNAVKYVARAGKKDPAKTKEDLEKAIWYIRRQIELMKDAPRRPNDMDGGRPPALPVSGGRPGAGRL